MNPKNHDNLRLNFIALIISTSFLFNFDFFLPGNCFSSLLSQHFCHLDMEKIKRLNIKSLTIEFDKLKQNKFYIRISLPDSI